MAGTGFLNGIFGSGKDEKQNKPLPPPALAVTPHLTASYNPMTKIKEMISSFSVQIDQMRDANLKNIVTINGRKPFEILSLESPRFFQAVADEKTKVVKQKDQIQAMMAIRGFIKAAKEKWNELTQKTQALADTKIFNEKLFIEISRINLDVLELLQDTMVKMDLALRAITPMTTLLTQTLQSLIHMATHVDVDLQGVSDDELFLKLQSTINKTQEYLSRVVGEVNKSASNINSKLAMPLPVAAPPAVNGNEEAVIPVTAEVVGSADDDDRFKPASPRRN